MGSEPNSIAGLTSHLDRALWHIYNVEELIQNFTTDKQDAVHQRLVELNDTLKDIDSSAETCPEVQHDAPARILAWIDEGKDPDEFVQKLFVETLGLHQNVRGKFNALLEGKRHYVKAMEEKMPELYQDYKAALTSTAATGQAAAKSSP